MQSKKIKNPKALYTEAFERLKQNKPIFLPVGTLVTQNNVAREAGRDPSSFKKSRFPTLILQIQEYIKLNYHTNTESNNGADLSSRKERRSRHRLLIDAKKERDKLSSKLDSADSTILELYAYIFELENKLNLNHIKTIN